MIEENAREQGEKQQLSLAIATPTPLETQQAKPKGTHTATTTSTVEQEAQACKKRHLMRRSLQPQPLQLPLTKPHFAYNRRKPCSKTLL